MNKGFTLIELMVVVAIIAVLVAVALPQYTGAQRKARESRIKADLKGIQNAQEVYYQTNNAYATSLGVLAWGSAAPTPPAGSGLTGYDNGQGVCTFAAATYTCTVSLSDGSFTVRNLQ